MRANLEDNRARGIRQQYGTYGVVELALVGDFTFTSETPSFVYLNPGNVARTVRLPAIGSGGGQQFWIKNTSSGTGNLNIVDLGGAAIGTLIPGSEGHIRSSSSAWHLNTLAGRPLGNNITYYVRTDGSDSNSGLVNSAGGAFRTIQHGIDVVSRLDFPHLSGNPAPIVQVADGTYTENLFFNDGIPIIPTGGPKLIGNVVTPSNVVVDGGHYVNASTWQVQGIKWVRSGGGLCFDVDMASFLFFESPWEFGAASGGHIFVHNGSRVYEHGAHTISGGGSFHWANESGGLIRSRGSTVTLTGTPNFTGQFMEGQSGASYQIDGNTYVGAATGQRFFLDGGVKVYTGTNGNLTYLPGNAAGVVRNGSTYDQISGPVSLGAPNTQTGATYTVTVDDTDIIANNAAATLTLTLPSAANFPGRELLVKTTQAQTVVSASANVVPLAGGAAGTAILAAIAGKWAKLRSDGSNWIIMASN